MSGWGGWGGFRRAIVTSMALLGIVSEAWTADSTGPHDVASSAEVQLDFFRGEEGQARLTFQGSITSPELRVERRPGFLAVELVERVQMPQGRETLDVEDFLTPVVRVRLERGEPQRLWLQLADRVPVFWSEHREGNRVVLEVHRGVDAARAMPANVHSPATVGGIAATDRSSAAQTSGDPSVVGNGISLDFQDLEVRALLTLFAEFTGLNIVATDQVSGRVTLRLDQVPWEQALDLILDVLALSQERVGDVIVVRPRAEFEARQLERLRREREVVELEPIRTALLAVQHGRAEDFHRTLMHFGSARMPPAREHDAGSVHVDARTNTLILHGPESRVHALSELVRALDTPTPQVLVETRIVIAEDSYLRDLGSRFGISASRQQGGTAIGISGQLSAAADLAMGLEYGLLLRPDLPQRLNWALPLPMAGSGAVSILRRGVILDLELRALQEQGRGKILSNPRIVTSSGHRASISDGNQIPYRTLTEVGTPGEVRLVPANLSAEVTPVVTPSQQIVLHIRITKDEPNFALVVDGQPAIRGRAIDTQVIVNNGETVVLGGIFEQSERSREQSIPVLGEIPVMGSLFRNRVTSAGQAELVVFVTPHILP
jgi:type IV pilus assembly protein PilQ